MLPSIDSDVARCDLDSTLPASAGKRYACGIMSTQPVAQPSAHGDRLTKRTKFLTTRQVADVLNVSRIFVTRMLRDKEVPGVVRAKSGRLLVPTASVERIHAEMKSASREALDRLNSLTSDARAREDAAGGPARRRWVIKS